MYSLRVDLKEKEASNMEPEHKDSLLVSDSPSDTIQFSAGNPRVEHITGLVHLYRQVPSTNGKEEDVEVAQGQGLLLCCLAIPADMSVASFCEFTGAYLAHIRNVRVLRREAVSQSVCMVTMEFHDQKTADDFYNDFNGKPFSILEPEILCRLVYVKDVELSSGSPKSPVAGHTELPSCPVCLERLDEHISGVVTTVCNHRFHGECLKQWGDTSCPVCRYCMQASEHSSKCSVCGTPTNLWICLICGHVGCGRYRDGHANEHWKTSGHCYALELETQRVWDYASDGYVHRLIQSKTDGKLIEVPSPAPACSASPRGPVGGADSTPARRGHRRSASGVATGSYGPSEELGEEEAAAVEEALLASKLDFIAAEYNHLLATQLDSQRQYFEGVVAGAVEAAEARVAEQRAASERFQAETHRALTQAKDAERRRQVLERRVAEVSAGAARVTEERDFLRSLNDTLLANQKDFTAQLEAARQDATTRAAQVKDLEEQVRDLMVFIEAQRTINEAGGGELRDATLLPVPEGGRGAKGAAARRRGGGRK